MRVNLNATRRNVSALLSHIFMEKLGKVFLIMTLALWTFEKILEGESVGRVAIISTTYGQTLNPSQNWSAYPPFEPNFMRKT
jgi:hypothetical protein